MLLFHLTTTLYTGGKKKTNKAHTHTHTHTQRKRTKKHKIRLKNDKHCRPISKGEHPQLFCTNHQDSHLQKSFFPRTVADWNNLEDSTVYTRVVERYRSFLLSSPFCCCCCCCCCFLWGGVVIVVVCSALPIFPWCLYQNWTSPA